MRQSYILYLVPDLFGPPSGIARYCRMVCRSLTESGIEVRVISLIDHPSAVTGAKEVFPAISYRPCQGSRLLFAWRAVTTVLRSRPSLVLVGHPNFSFLGYVLSRLARVKLAVFMYGTDVWQPLKPLRRLALCRAHRYLSISQFTARRAIEANKILAAKIRILPNCLDTQFENQSGDNFTNDNAVPSILTVSRITWFEPYKGQESVIKAMPALLSRFPDLIYNVVGDGDRRASLEELAAAEGVSHAVRFHGVVSDEVLAGLYRQASVFVMPSLVEGFGFVFLEAMAQGTPAIGGDKDAAPEVIVNGETGYVVDPTSIPAIGEAISRLLSDPALRQRMGQAAILHAKEKFGFPRFQNNLIAYLLELKAIPMPDKRKNPS
jgi:glycosyltransferase involved in cell wall biosynthesis